MRIARNKIIVMKLYFDRLPGFIIFQKCLFFIFYSFSHQLFHFPCLVPVILHNSRQVLKVDRTSLLIIYVRLYVAVRLLFRMFSISALRTISFLGFFFHFIFSLSCIESISHCSCVRVCVCMWVLSFTSIFCGYCTFAEIRQHHIEMIMSEFHSNSTRALFISVINLSYRSFRHTSRIHFTLFHVTIAHILTFHWFVSFLYFAFISSSCLFSRWKSSLMRLKSGFSTHINVNVNELYRCEQSIMIEMNTKALLTWRFSLCRRASFKISFANWCAC